MTRLITSSANPRVKGAIRLKVGKNRRREKRFLVDGIRGINRALDAGINILEVFTPEPVGSTENELPNLKTAERASLFEKLTQKNIPIWTLPLHLFEKLVFGERGECESLIAVAQTPEDCWDENRLPENPIFAVVEQVEKPGNLGAIFRSADGAGIDGLLIANPLCDIFNPNTVRSSLGTVFQLSFQTGTSVQILAYLRSRQVRIAAALCDGAIPYTEFDFRGPVAIVFGNEANGLSPIWQGEDITPIRVPMLGMADSLNVSNAAAILFYEALRQRAGCSQVLLRDWARYVNLVIF